MKKGYKQLVDEANAQIKTYSVAEAQAKLGDPGVQFVDVRDIRELEREGIVPRCVSCTTRHDRVLG